MENLKALITASVLSISPVILQNTWLEFDYHLKIIHATKWHVEM